MMADSSAAEGASFFAAATQARAREASSALGVAALRRQWGEQQQRGRRPSPRQTRPGETSRMTRARAARPSPRGSAPPPRQHLPGASLGGPQCFGPAERRPAHRGLAPEREPGEPARPGAHSRRPGTPCHPSRARSLPSCAVRGRLQLLTGLPAAGVVRRAAVAMRVTAAGGVRRNTRETWAIDIGLRHTAPGVSGARKSRMSGRERKT